MDSGRNLSLLKNGESLVEPEIAPVLAGDVISGPRVSNLMDCNINLRFVASDDGWGGKSEKWVLHATHGERWWQDEDAVVAPNVWSQVIFSIVKELLELVQFLGNSVKPAWLSDDSNSSAE